MAKKIKVKTVITLDSADLYFHEIETTYDANLHGTDLAEAIKQAASMIVNEIVKEIVEGDLPA